MSGKEIDSLWLNKEDIVKGLTPKVTYKILDDKDRINTTAYQLKRLELLHKTKTNPKQKSLREDY